MVNWASMGPRSFDRGNDELLIGRNLASWLQWGRDLSIAEISRNRYYALCKLNASMGPRSFDRGNGG